MTYDHFIGDINCVHAVVFSLSDEPHEQHAQVMYWLHFITARVPLWEPVGE